MRRPRYWPVLFVLLAIAAGLLSAPSPAPARNSLNGPLYSGGVYNLGLSPDSRHVVFHTDRDRDDRFELYSVSLMGGAPVQLNRTPPGDTDTFFPFEFSPDGQRVVYQAGVFGGLYSVTISGTASITLTDTTSFSFEISPDGRRVVYLGQHGVGTAWTLYSVPITGGTTVELGGAPPSSDSFHVSPDGRYVVYEHVNQQPAASLVDLYSVPIGGGTPVKLNGTVANNLGYFPHAISPDGSHVIFAGYQESQPGGWLYRVPIDGGTPVRLSDQPVLLTPDFKISPNGDYVVYYVLKPDIWTPELYSVPLSGGMPVKLNPPLAAGESAHRCDISPDSSRVVYYVGQHLDTRTAQLYSVPIGGGTPVKLNEPPVAGGGVQTFAISSDSRRVVYSGDLDVRGRYELYSAPLGGGASVKLSDRLPQDLELIYSQISPDSSRVVYGIGRDQGTPGVSIETLYSVPIDADARTGFRGVIVGRRNIEYFLFTPDGEYLVYTAHHDFDEGNELYAFSFLNDEPLPPMYTLLMPLVRQTRRGPGTR